MGFKWSIRIALALLVLAGAAYLTRPWWKPVEPPVVEGEPRRVAPRPPFIEGPRGSRAAPFADTTGEVEEVPVEGDPDATITVEPDTGGGKSSDTRLAVERVRTLFPDFTRRPSVRVRCAEDCPSTTVVYPPAAIVSLTPRITAGVGVAGRSPALLLNASPLRVWGVRVGGFAYAGAEEVGAGPSLSTRLLEDVDVVVGADLVGGGGVAGVTIHF